MRSVALVGFFCLLGVKGFDHKRPRCNKGRILLNRFGTEFFKGDRSADGVILSSGLTAITRRHRGGDNRSS